MCQAFEGEQQYVVQRDLAEIRKKYEDHKNGTKPLSDEELLKLAVEKMMLLEVG